MAARGQALRPLLVTLHHHHCLHVHSYHLSGPHRAFKGGLTTAKWPRALRLGPMSPSRPIHTPVLPFSRRRRRGVADDSRLRRHILT